MKRIEPPDLHHLSAATGWLELGNCEEAALDLEKICPQLHSHPDVLEVKYEILAKSAKWDEAVEVARLIVESAPRRAFGWVHSAFALHELKRTREAYDTLLPVVDRFPREWVMRYNLACYACQLGSQDDAMKWLNKAYSMGDQKQLKQMALDDPDLAPLRAVIAKT